MLMFDRTIFSSPSAPMTWTMITALVLGVVFMAPSHGLMIDQLVLYRVLLNVEFGVGPGSWCHIERCFLIVV